MACWVPKSIITKQNSLKFSFHFNFSNHKSLSSLNWRWLSNYDDNSVDQDQRPERTKFDEKHEYGCRFLISWYGPIRSRQNSPIWHPCPGIAAKIIRQVTSHCQIINIQHRNSIWISTLWRFILFQFFQFVKIEEFLILKLLKEKFKQIQTCFFCTSFKRAIFYKRFCDLVMKLF